MSNANVMTEAARLDRELRARARRGEVSFHTSLGRCLRQAARLQASLRELARRCRDDGNDDHALLGEVAGAEATMLESTASLMRGCYLRWLDNGAKGEGEPW